MKKKYIYIIFLFVFLIAIYYSRNDIVLYFNSLRVGYYEENNLYDECINIYSDMIETKPTAYEFYINRGVAYAQLEEYQKAEKDFKTALSLNDKDKDIYYNLYLIYDIKNSTKKNYYFEKYQELKEND